MVDVAEHVYHDDPTDGHPDVRTRLAGASYFFLGNGSIQGAVQFAPGGEGTPLGLLIMDPERLRKKREALTLDPERGLEPTVVEIVTPSGTARPVAGSLTVGWARDRDVPTVEARWDAPGVGVVERFICPGTEPSLSRAIEVTNRSALVQSISVRTAGTEETAGGPVVLEPGARARFQLNYDLEADGTVTLSGVGIRDLEAGPSAFGEAPADRRSLGGGWSGPACAPGLKPRPPADTGERALRGRGTDQALAPPESEPGRAGGLDIAFHDPLLDRMFHAARCQLPAVISTRGRLDGSIWQYNREWVRDQAVIALALTQLGQRSLAATMLRRLLREFVTDKGATLDSSEVRGRDDVELDQNGVLLYVLAQHVWWTGDTSLVTEEWPRVAALAEYPLRAEFRHEPSGMLRGCREYWERHAAHGIEPGFELCYQMFVSVGLASGADLAAKLGRTTDAARWRAAASGLRDAILAHPTHALHDRRGFIKRRTLDGRIQEEVAPRPDSGLPGGVPLAEDRAHLLNPDTCCVLPIVFGLVAPDSPVATATLASVETLWNQAWQGGGYGRYHESSEPDSPGGWPFASLFVARAAVEAGRSEPFWRVLRWMDSAPGAAAGSWFEFYGPRPSPPCPQVGVIPWTWAELTLLFVSHVLGVRPEADKIRIRPRLPAGLERVTARLPVGSGWIYLQVTADTGATYHEALLDRPDGIATIELSVPPLP